MTELAIDPQQVWETQVFEHDRQFLNCRFSPCGKYLFAGGMDNRLHRCELASQKRTAIEGHTSWVGALAFHPDSQRLLTADYVGGLRCWNYADDSPKPLWSVDAAHPGAIRAVAVSADGRFLATAGHDAVVRVWSAEGGKPVHEFAGHQSPVFAIAFHPQTRSLVSAEQFGVVKHWDLESGTLSRDLDAKLLFTSASLNGGAETCGVRSLTFNAAGTVLACAGITQLTDGDRRGGDASILLLNWDDGSRKQMLVAKKAGYVEQLVFHPDDYVIAACLTQENGSVQFWKGAGAEPVHQFQSGCRDIDLHPDGNRIAVCEWTRHGKVGNNASTETLEPFEPNHGAVRIHSLTPKPAEDAVPKAG